MNKQRHYIFHESTISLCSQCLCKIPAKIIIKDKSVYLLKNCLKHGEQLELLEEDAEYWLKRREYDKPGTKCRLQTKINKGCPFDCGLCPSHEQHTCIGLIEITNKCDLKCPVCYACSGEGEFLDVSKIETMMDFYQNSEYNKGEILQISGGEPTTHPKILEILKIAMSKKFSYVMLNTNGLRIANDEEFVRELSKFKSKGGFEVYLQFDGFCRKAHKKIRGKEDILELKKKAISNLQKYKIPITLVVTVEEEVNDKEIGRIVEFGMKEDYIRGINFQPIAFFGRLDKHNLKNRATITGILKKIEKQTKGKLKKQDFIPLPCNVERVAITYLYKKDGEFFPITRNVKIKKYLPMIKNTFAFNTEGVFKQTAKSLLKGRVCQCLSFLNDFKSLIPINLNFKSKEDKIDYVNNNTFRISVTSFIDVYNFDIKSMQKECVHFITPDLKKIPFSAYNMFHRKCLKK